MIDFASPVGVSAVADARELLAEFAATGRQEPFEEVVRRYGGMVFNLCFEVTGNRHDAEDAMQAAFLSLAVQVKSGQVIVAIGPWLQQVARRLSLDVNRSRKRRKKREDRFGNQWEQRQMDGVEVDRSANVTPVAAAGWEEMREIIKVELEALPAKYRMPLIMHYYGGLTRDEMARELGCRANTLGVRLHRGRDMLGKRLAKRGLALSAVTFGVLMGEMVRNIVADHVVSSTAHAAALMGAGHPYACGVVAPSVVELAKTAGRAVVMARIKVATFVGMMTCGAMAAGAEMKKGGMLDTSGWNVGKVLKTWLSSPSAPAPVRRSYPLPGGISAKPSPEWESPAVKEAEAKIEAWQGEVKKLDWANGWNVPSVRSMISGDGNWRGVGPTGGDSAVAGQTGGGGNRKLGPDLAPPNAPRNYGSAPAVAGGGGGGGGNGKGGKGSDKNEVDGDGIAKQSEPKDDHIKDRGGVKQPPETDVASGGQTKGRQHTPGTGGGGSGTGTGPSRSVPDAPPPGTIPGPILPLPGTDDKQDANKVTAPTPTDANQNSQGGIRDGRRLNVSTDLNVGGTAPSFEEISGAPVGKAKLEITGGETTNEDVLIGYLGTGIGRQSGGTHTVDSLFLGVVKSGRGLYQLSGGELKVVKSLNDPEAAPHLIEVGGAGEGVLQLGNTTGTGSIVETGEGNGVGMTIGGIRSANGTVRGWGTIGLTGGLVNNGRVIAEGYGVDRTLDLTSFSSVSRDFVNRDVRGWYAQDHGRLELPAITVGRGTGTITWGDSADDDLSMVNSVRMTVHEAQAEVKVKMALVALDRSDLPTLRGGHHFIGAWSFDGGGLVADGGVDLSIRYDDALAHSMGLDENVLKIWTHENGEWIRHDFDGTFLRDPAAHVLSVHLDRAGFDYLGVSAPEPSVVGLVGIVGAMGLLRRRRK